MYKIKRYHDISAGHRVAGHESKCRHLHGHNYRIHFTCASDSAGFTKAVSAALELDTLGRVIDFGVVKEKLCMWVEENWDHKFLCWQNDQLIKSLRYVSSNTDEDEMSIDDYNMFLSSLVLLPFNPTAENMAQYLVEVIGPKQLAGTGVVLIEVTIEETAKCHATYTKEGY